jgi:hypothetical protein
MTKAGEQRISAPKSRECVWSSEDQAHYDRWRRGVFIFYGAIGLSAIVAVAVFQLAGVAIQFAGK